MTANKQSKKLTLRIPSKPTLIFDKNEENAMTEAEFQELDYMQQAFKLLKNGISCNLGMRLNG